ncbi:PH domain-containing protein [Clostridium sp. Marseille-P299]|uniref:PH domain-containing protein n=1 Tax=Clostridium sp. Marseille-P299 TaxID=1805477 RepID=UPI000B19AE7B|nr:PH domain-containing protein [Clostridium sp. Marseille-P299]
MEPIFIEKKRTKFLGLPICFVTYYIMEDKITIKSGFLNTVEDDAYMYKVQDVRLTRSFMERIFGLSTIICYTGDTTHKELTFQHIKNARNIKEYLITASEEARRKRRTMHTMDIDADFDDGFIDA